MMRLLCDVESWLVALDTTPLRKVGLDHGFGPLSFVFVERFWIAGHCKSKALKEPQKEVVRVSFVMSIYMT